MFSGVLNGTFSRIRATKFEIIPSRESLLMFQGDFGGYMGLLLGASVVSIIELLDWCIYRCIIQSQLIKLKSPKITQVAAFNAKSNNQSQAGKNVHADQFGSRFSSAFFDDDIKVNLNANNSNQDSPPNGKKKDMVSSTNGRGYTNGDLPAVSM